MSSTVSPNILGWDGRRDARNGDPDNSALTGASWKIYSYKNGNLLFLLTVSLYSYLIHNIPNSIFSM
jgi:hypothetical protein